MSPKAVRVEMNIGLFKLDSYFFDFSFLGLKTTLKNNYMVGQVRVGFGTLLGRLQLSPPSFAHWSRWRGLRANPKITTQGEECLLFARLVWFSVSFVLFCLV